MSQFKAIVVEGNDPDVMKTVTAVSAAIKQLGHLEKAKVMVGVLLIASSMANTMGIPMEVLTDNLLEMRTTIASTKKTEAERLWALGQPPATADGGN